MARRGDNVKGRMRLKSQPLVPNAGIAASYYTELRKMVVAMVKDSYRPIIDQYRSIKSPGKIENIEVLELLDLVDELGERSKSIFENNADKVAGNMVLETVKYAEATTPAKIRAMLQHTAGVVANPVNGGGINLTFNAANQGGISLGLWDVGGFAVNAPVVSEEIREQVTVAIKENVSLIKSIPAQYHDRISGAVTRSLQANGSIKQLAEEIKEYGKMSLRRAHLIALDQMKKTFTARNWAEFKQHGVTKFEWVHTGGSLRPREHHLAEYPHGLNHGIFDLDDPPVIDPKTGEKGYPAQLPFCHCMMCAVVEM